MKTIHILILVVVLAIIAALVYYFFGENKNAANGFVSGFFGGSSITVGPNSEGKLDLGLADERLRVTGYNDARIDLYDTSQIDAKANRPAQTNTNRLGV